jgi:hypothetical protein
LHSYFCSPPVAISKVPCTDAVRRKGALHVEGSAVHCPAAGPDVVCDVGTCADVHCVVYMHCRVSRLMLCRRCYRLPAR